MAYYVSCKLNLKQVIYVLWSSRVIINVLNFINPLGNNDIWIWNAINIEYTSSLQSMTKRQN